jgi:hypothetical protein
MGARELEKVGEKRVFRGCRVTETEELDILEARGGASTLRAWGGPTGCRATDDAMMSGPWSSPCLFCLAWAFSAADADRAVSFFGEGLTEICLPRGVGKAEG